MFSGVTGLQRRNIVSSGVGLRFWKPAPQARSCRLPHIVCSKLGMYGGSTGKPGKQLRQKMLRKLPVTQATYCRFVHFMKRAGREAAKEIANAEGGLLFVLGWTRRPIS